MTENRSPHQWSEILAAYPERTGSRDEFCDYHGISAATLYYHMRKARVDNNPEKTNTIAVPQSSSQPAQPRLIALRHADTHSRTAATGTELAGTELAFTEFELDHPKIGALTIRCHHLQISAIIDQLSDSCHDLA